MSNISNKSDLLSQEMKNSFKRNCSLHVRWLQEPKFIQQLSEDNIDINLIDRQLYSHVTSKRNNQSKQMILNILNCYPVQIVIAILVLIDAGIIIAEIVLEIHAMKNKIEAYSEQMRETIHFLNNAYEFNPKFVHLMSHTHERPGSKHLSDQSPYTSSQFDTKDLSSHEALDLLSEIVESIPKLNIGLPSCNKISLDQKQPIKSHRTKQLQLQTNQKVKHNHNVLTAHRKRQSSNLHKASEKLHFASIAILSFFVIELTVRVICIGPVYFKARFEIIDAIVILTSFIADVIIVIVGSQEISIMIIFLLWRIVRVINGLLMHEKKRDEFRIFLQKKARRLSEMKMEELLIEKEMQEKRFIALEELCYREGIPESDINKCRLKMTRLGKCTNSNPLKSIAALTTGFMGTLVNANIVTNKIIHKMTFPSNHHHHEATPSSRNYNNNFLSPNLHAFNKTFSSISDISSTSSNHMFHSDDKRQKFYRETQRRMSKSCTSLLFRSEDSHDKTPTSIKYYVDSPIVTD